MSIAEKTALDMSAILMQAFEVGDLINESKEVANYLYWKNKVDTDEEVQRKVKLFAKKKELFEECQRFGRFHPEYHNAMEHVNTIQNELAELEAVRNFKQAEDGLDDLLYTISVTIAHSVSETIKVPSNNPLPSGGGCSTGGSCSGKCG